MPMLQHRMRGAINSTVSARRPVKASQPGDARRIATSAGRGTYEKGGRLIRVVGKRCDLGTSEERTFFLYFGLRTSSHGLLEIHLKATGHFSYTAAVREFEASLATCALRLHRSAIRPRTAARSPRRIAQVTFWHTRQESPL